MFPVPGWSVANSDLKVQKEQPSQRPQAEQSNQEAGDAKAGSRGQSQSQQRKRKRGKDGSADKVTASNVDEMWRINMEGQKPGADKKKAEKMKNKEKKKRRKLEIGTSGTQDGVKMLQESGQSADGEVNGAPQDQRSAASGEKEKHTPQETKKQKQKKRKSQDNEKDKQTTNTAASAVAESLPPPPPPSSTLTPLQQSMRQKLLSARFRHLNETLYTTPSQQALDLFTANPELFTEYHAGFSQQVKESWPSNPVDGYIRAVKSRGSIKQQKNQKFNRKPQFGKGNGKGELLPRRPNGLCTIADLGCGDAQLARALQPGLKKLNLKIHSFDLHESDPLITKADIANLPVPDGSVDVAVFCLSLMGTNWISFVEEAWRVLRGDGKGECWVSEVKSRFGKVMKSKNKQQPQKPAGKKDKSKKKKKQDDEGEEAADDEIFAENQSGMTAADGDETDISAFVEVFRTRGFVLKEGSVDKSNKMFVKMEFCKQGRPVKGKFAAERPPTAGFGKPRFIETEDKGGMSLEEESKVLKPCVYKIR